MKQWFIVLLVVLFLAGCSSKSTPTYELIIGQQTIIMPVHDDPKLIQDDLLAAAEPLWKNLKQGESEAFQYRRILAWEPALENPEKVKERFRDNITLSATSTKSSPKIRFFKDRNGKNGARLADVLFFHGNVTEWNTVAELIKSHAFTVDRIRRTIQGQWLQEAEVNKNE